MRVGKYKNQEVKVYECEDQYIVEFNNGSSITTNDISEIQFTVSFNPKIDKTIIQQLPEEKSYYITLISKLISELVDNQIITPNHKSVTMILFHKFGYFSISPSGCGLYRRCGLRNYKISS